MAIALRYRRWILVVWAVGVALAWVLAAPPSSWHFFHDSAGLIMGRNARGGGLGMWRSHPDLQFGPATVAVAVVLRLIAGNHDALAAKLLLTPLAVLIVWLVEDAALAIRPSSDRAATWVTALVGGIVLVPIWDYVALASLHLDDGIALFAATLAVWALARRHPLILAIALGVAANAKPWAVVFLPLAFAVAPSCRRRTVAIAGAIAVVPWLPFLLGAPGTIAALGSFHIHTMATSGLRALGIHDRRTPPWDRPVQVVVGTCAALWATRHDRWAGVILVGVATRLLLDPGAHLYYSAGLVVGAFIWDVLASPARVPWATIVTAVGLQGPRIMHWPAPVSSWLRVAVTVGCIVAVLLVRPRPATPAVEQEPERHRPPEPIPSPRHRRQVAA